MALRTNKLFWAIILDGALLTACGNPDIETDTSGSSDADADADADTDTDTDADADSDADADADADTDADTCPDDCLAEDYSQSGIDSWESCSPDTDVCCWTTGDCCDLCCENW